jgi:hypothetical protein
MYDSEIERAQQAEADVEAEAKAEAEAEADADSDGGAAPKRRKRVPKEPLLQMASILGRRRVKPSEPPPLDAILLPPSHLYVLPAEPGAENAPKDNDDDPEYEYYVCRWQGRSS